MPLWRRALRSVPIGPSMGGEPSGGAGPAWGHAMTAYRYKVAGETVTLEVDPSVVAVRFDDVPVTKEETDAGPPVPGVEFDPHYMERMIVRGRARGHQGRWNLVAPSEESQ
jgi:hypothetical protein